MNPSNGFSLMIIEDSPEDFHAIERILKNNPVGYSIAHFRDGDTALAYVATLQENQAQGVPGLILLDLNLPGTDGRELLQVLKSHEATRMIPVVVTTTSSNPHDITYCYEQGANGYFVKPVNFKRLQEGLTTIVEYWFGIVTPYSSVRSNDLN